MDILNIEESSNILKRINYNNKVVFITGVTGQDGSLLADYLLNYTNCIVIGGVRRLSVENHENIKHLENNNRFLKVNFDLNDSHNIYKIVKFLKPDYFVNLAAHSFVGSSWDFPTQTWNCNATSIIHILEAIQQFNPKCRFYNAGSSEEFGNVEYTPQDEKHPLKPRSPYGASKAAARHIVKVYRESYKLFAIQGLLFNHEGPRRGEEFVTRKITKGVGRIKRALLQNEPFEPIELGNVDAKRDWSDAEDFVQGIWLMLNQNEPKEYVLSSNEIHSVREFVTLAFKHANIEGVWNGNGINEQFCISVNDYKSYEPKSSVLVKINPKFFRPAEVDLLSGNSNKARQELNWRPKTSFEELIRKMVNRDLQF